MIVIRVVDYSEFPGPRLAITGPSSGEEFRDTVLLKKILEHPNDEISIDLDGTAGYGSSFLEETFGGLVRAGIPYSRVKEICKNLKSEEDPSLIDEINEYVTDAYEVNVSHG